MMELDRFRRQFEPVRQGRVFLNHCGVSPLPDCSANAMKEAIERTQSLTPDDWTWLMARVDESRAAAAEMIGAREDEIALTRNTTEGIAWVANGLRWKPGDCIVSVNGEYPANIYPWMRQQQHGVEFHLIEPVENRVTLEMLEQALTPNTRVLAVSFVEFASGFRFDLEAAGRLCRERGVLLVVDLIQGLGALPLDVKRAQVAFASCGAQKWLLGPQGAAFFYCNRDRLEEIDVTQPGSDTMVNKIPYLEYTYAPRADARRFEFSTLPTIPLIGMNASLRFLLEAGSETIASRMKRLTDILVEGMTAKGYVCHSPRREGEWSGIVSFTPPNGTVADALARLSAKRVFTVEREGLLRLAPHFYQTEEEMERVVEAAHALHGG